MTNGDWAKWGLRTLLILIWGAVVTILTIHHNGITANADKISDNATNTLLGRSELRKELVIAVEDIKSDISDVRVAQEKTSTQILVAIERLKTQMENR